MRTNQGNGLATLRRWRRDVCSVLLPAFGLWAFTAPACLARLGSALPEPTATALAASHMGHDHASMHDEHAGHAASTQHCPHCPPATDTGTSPVPCTVDAGASATGVPSKGAAAESAPLFIAARFAPPPSVPTLRLREAGAPDTARYRAHVPLNIRHCVFLI